MKSTTGIAQAMGKLSSEEFVVNDLNMPILQNIGVDHLQGYGVSNARPLNTLDTDSLEALNHISITSDSQS